MTPVPPLCPPSAPSVPPLCPLCAPPVPPLCPLCAPPVPPQCPPSAPSVPPLCPPCAPPVPPQCPPCAPSVPPLCPPSAPSVSPLCPPSAPPVPPLCPLCAPPVPPLCPLCAVPPLCPPSAPSVPPLCPLCVPPVPPQCPLCAPPVPPLCPLCAPPVPPLCPPLLWQVYNWRKSMMPVLMGASTILGIFPTLAMINAEVDPQRPLPLYATAVVAGLLVTITGGNIRTVFLNVNKPEVRGTVFGIFCIMDDVGKGFGPVIAAQLISRLGRVRAFNACIWMWTLCGLALMSIGGTLVRDERRMQTALAACVEMECVDAFGDGGLRNGTRAAGDGESDDDIFGSDVDLDGDGVELIRVADGSVRPDLPEASPEEQE